MVEDAGMKLITSVAEVKKHLANTNLTSKISGKKIRINFQKFFGRNFRLFFDSLPNAYQIRNFML